MPRVRTIAALGVALAVALSFASCGGGGGGGGGGGTMNPPPTPTPSPSLCPSPSGGSYPPGECTTFALSGASTQTTSRTAPTPTPPPLTTNDTIAESAIVHNNRSFHAQPASDYLTTETDAGPNQTITTTSNDYFVFPPITGGPIVNIGFHSTDSNGVVIDEQNLAGNGIVGELPPSGWTNNAAQTIVENDPDLTMTTTNIAADGSYSATKNEVAGQTTISANPNGSANEIIPADPFGVGGASTEISIGPVSGGNIVINVCIPSGTTATPCATPAPQSAILPAWYPASPTLASDVATSTGTGTTSIPPGCTPLATSGTQFHELKSRIDTILGYREDETIDTWAVSGTGPVCQRISDTLNLYYDFTGQTLSPFNSTPIQTTTFSELIGLQTVTLGAARHPLNARSSLGSLGPQIAIANARVERFRQAFRTKQLRSLRAFVLRGHLK